MSTIFLVSLVLLGGLIGLHQYEQRRSTRFVERLRVWLDKKHLSAVKKLQHACSVSIEYAHRDVLMKFLHITSYLTLLSVQWVERKLVVITRFFRSFRRKKVRRDDLKE
jgi:hypothetical protein